MQKRRDLSRAWIPDGTERQFETRVLKAFYEELERLSQIDPAGRAAIDRLSDIHPQTAKRRPVQDAPLREIDTDQAVDRAALRRAGVVVLGLLDQLLVSSHTPVDRSYGFLPS